MNTFIIQQEILLVTTTEFSHREWCYKDSNNNYLSHEQQLEEACWNGMLQELLPELVKRAPSGKTLYLWHIRQGEDCLQIQLSEFPVSVNRQCSIDTNFFLPLLLANS